MEVSYEFNVPNQRPQQGSGSPYELSFNDFNDPTSPDPRHLHQSLPPTPFTPSYAANAGSYQNSPYQSDFSFGPAQEPDTHAPLDDPLGEVSFPITYDIDQSDNTYDPSSYDAPAEQSLLFSGFLQSLNDANLSMPSKSSFSSNFQQQESNSPSPSNSSIGSNVNNFQNVSVSVTPALEDRQGAGMGSYSPYDHGSPASSNGEGTHNANRSRASSISSQRNQPFGQAGLPQGMQQRGYTPSSDFESMVLQQQQQQQFHQQHQSQSPSPAPGQYGMAQYPASPPPSAGLTQKPQSPPALFIPAEPPQITHTGTGTPSPTRSDPGNNMSLGVNGNNDVGGLGAATIQIVPATPVSAVVAAANAAAQASLNVGQPQAGGMSHRGTPSPAPSYQALPTHSNNIAKLPQAPPSPYTFPPAMTPPPSGGTMTLPPSSGLKTEYPESPNLGALQLGLEQQQQQQQGQEFLIPISNSSRTRSKSDTQFRPPPSWQLGVGSIDNNQQGQQQQQMTMNNDMSFGAVGPQGLPSLPTLNPSPGHSPALQPPPLPNHYSYGPPAQTMPGEMNNNFLSPNFNLGGGFGGVDGLRRAKSESGGHPLGHKRNALSEDIRSSSYNNNSLLYPPQNNFTSRSGASTPSIGGSPALGSQQYLTPDGGGAAGDFGNLGLGLPGVGMGPMNPSSVGAHRRSWSGGHGHTRSLSRERLSTSPYPSPHASPRANMEPLPDSGLGFGAGMGMGMGMSVYGGQSADTTALNGQQGMNGGGVSVHVMSTDGNGNPTVQPQQPISVPRQNVTTHATADASHRRRRTEANFICPVPGCGSTFTRHFNLKGHLRSHNEERPFKCKWPGCDKGFARQHDCKRHEQLHLNIRPYVCQGCNRTFARMDALNRHLRSDAGTECQARQPILTSDQPNNPEHVTNGAMDEDGAAANGSANGYSGGVTL